MKPPCVYHDDVELMSYFEAKSGVRSGQLCFVGTRLTVKDILEYLASGMSVHQIVADFPELTEQHVRAAVEFDELQRHYISPR